MLYQGSFCRRALARLAALVAVVSVASCASEDATGTNRAAALRVSADLPGDVTCQLPNDVIKQMDIWAITLPIEGKPGKPLTLDPDDFAKTLIPPWYYRSTDGDVVFRALCACDDEALAAGRTDCGYHTATSSYARSELRERAAWSTSMGEHIMETSVTITHVATTGRPKPDVVVNQIHDETDDIVLVRLRPPRGSARVEPTGTFCEDGCPAPLVVEGSVLGPDGKPSGQGSAVWYGVLDPAYQIGTPFRTRIHAHDGQVDVYFWYEGDDVPSEPNVIVPANTTGCYFKAGAYNHAGMKPSKGACEPNDFAEVRFSNIDVTHIDE